MTSSPPEASSPPATSSPPELLQRTDGATDLGRAFKSVLAAVRRLRGRETHRPGELSYAGYTLLFNLAEESELSARDLAVAADLSPATVTQMLEALAEAGLVERVRSARDRRIVLNSLTPRGREMVQSRHAKVEPRWRDALAEFSDAELRTAARVLDRIRTMFEEFEE